MGDWDEEGGTMKTRVGFGERNWAWVPGQGWGGMPRVRQRSGEELKGSVGARPGWRERSTTPPFDDHVRLMIG